MGVITHTIAMDRLSSYFQAQSFCPRLECWQLGNSSYEVSDFKKSPHSAQTDQQSPSSHWTRISKEHSRILLPLPSLTRSLALTSASGEVLSVPEALANPLVNRINGSFG